MKNIPEMDFPVFFAEMGIPNIQQIYLDQYEACKYVLAPSIEPSHGGMPNFINTWSVYREGIAPLIKFCTRENGHYNVFMASDPYMGVDTTHNNLLVYNNKQYEDIYTEHHAALVEKYESNTADFPTDKLKVYKLLEFIESVFRIRNTNTGQRFLHDSAFNIISVWSNANPSVGKEHALSSNNIQLIRFKRRDIEIVYSYQMPSKRHALHILMDKMLIAIDPELTGGKIVQYLNLLLD